MTCLLSIGGAYGGVTGDANAIESCLDLSWSGTYDPLYPLSNLRLGVTRQPWKAGAVGADQYLAFNLRRYPGGGFEGASVLADGWTQLVGTGTKSTAQHRTGLASALLNDGEKLSRTVRVRAGAPYSLEAWIKSTDGTGVGSVTVYDTRAQKWLSGGDVWGTEVQYGTGNDTAWQQIAGNETPAPVFTTLPADEVGGSYTTLQIIIEASGGDVHFDDVELRPVINSCVIAGHNLTPAISVDLNSPALSLTPQVGAFYGRGGTNATADATVTFTGTPEDPISIGGLWLCYMQEITPPRREHTMDVLFRQQEKSGFVLEQSTQEQRRLPLSWEFGEGDGLTPREAYEAFRDAFLRPARGQAYPFALVWDVEDEPGGVMLARLEEKGWSVTREGTLWKVSATLVEMELPAESS